MTNIPHSEEPECQSIRTVTEDTGIHRIPEQRKEVYTWVTERKSRPKHSSETSIPFTFHI